MTEHKFTDEEIVAHMLAYCGGMCGKCEVAKSFCCGSCVILRIRDAIDLINRQKAEVSFWMDAAANAKKEAIKEFAERLKANMSNIARMEYGGYTYFCVGYDLIDTLVKEMTGGDENG